MAKRYNKREVRIGRRLKEESLRKSNIILNIMLIIFIVLFALSSIKIIKWFINNRENEMIKVETSKAVIITETTEGKKDYKVDFTSLKSQNTDTIGWIKVNNTNIEFPVVKTTNNGYYLSRNFNKEYNLGGWIFADYKNKFDGTDKNIVIYGHNMRDNSMFGTLKEVLKEEWYNNKENHEIIFVTENEEAKYQVFSVYEIEEEEYYINTKFENEEEFGKFINTLKQRSKNNFNVEVNSSDNIVTLSTCANNNKYRVVLHAKKITNSNSEN